MIAGPASPDLADRVAKGLGAHLVATELRVFSDGENKIKIDKMGKNCVIVQSTYPPADTHLMQALMMAIKCADGAHDVCAVIPYLAYARQDRAFLAGEVVSIALVAKLLQSAGVRHVITVDIHSKLAMSHFASVQNVSSIPLLAEYASRMMLCRPIAVSPDAGGADRAKEFAKHSKIDALVLKKSRDKTTGEVKVEEKLDIDLSGRDALLVDDMISSGGSIVKQSIRNVCPSALDRRRCSKDQGSRRTRYYCHQFCPRGIRQGRPESCHSRGRKIPLQLSINLAGLIIALAKW